MCLDFAVRKEQMVLNTLLFPITGLIAAEGDLWKEHRKFVVKFLTTAGVNKFSSLKRDKLETNILSMVDEAVLVIDYFNRTIITYILS